MHDKLLEFGDGGRKKRLTYGIIGVVSLVLISLIVVGVVFLVPQSQDHSIGANQPITAADNSDAPLTIDTSKAVSSDSALISRPVILVLPTSAQGEFLQLVRTDVKRENGEFPSVARSYDGNPWEPVYDLDYRPISLACFGTSCEIRPGGTYQVRKISVPENLANPTPQELFSRLYTQATFGANKAELQGAVTKYRNDYTRWIRDQMDPNLMTLHRAYYRQRTSPRERNTSNDDIANFFSPCEVGSRWHRFAFNGYDTGKTMEISKNGGVYTVRIDRIIRAQVNTELFPTATGINFPSNFRICSVQESVGGIIKVGAQCNIDCVNPALQLSTIDVSSTLSLTSTEATLAPFTINSDVFFLTRVPSIRCTVPFLNAFLRFNGVFYRHDARLKLLQNTVDQPTTSFSANLQCPTVVKTFLNERKCLRARACAPQVFSSVNIPLNQTTLRAWYTDSQRFVYYFTGLRLEEPFRVSPCKDTSRWLRLGTARCPNQTNLDAGTLSTLVAALSGSTDRNPYVRDINVGGKTCVQSPESIGAQVYANGECFQHVHPDLYSVRDATYWSVNHDGNPSALAGGRPNPIKKWAEQGLVYLNFPGWHDMQRWSDKRNLLPVIGRYGDTVDFRSLQTELQTVPMGIRFGAIQSQSNEGFEICGSPGEVANDPSLGHHYILPSPASNSEEIPDLDFPQGTDVGKSLVWMNVVLKSPDQLRQRVAWALAQIFTVGRSGLDRTSDIEPWGAYFDIFVRNAFGNYRDIMREVAYHPMMSMYLSYYQNRAFAVSGNYPDENFAREIMQLFSIGLWQLNDDGTQKLDGNGDPIPTYTIDDIVEYARLWTGFDTQLMRSNLERSQGSGSKNVIDPLQIKVLNRDFFPKTRLDDGYIGDRYPLCDDLPPQHWLTEGARFIFTGSSSDEGQIMDSESNKTSGYRGRFAPTPGKSQLYQLLCQPDTTGRCTFPSEVVIRQNIPCDGEECTAGRVTTVKIYDVVARLTRYYTYISVPCVRLTYFAGKHTVAQSRRQCTHPKFAVASPACCRQNGLTRLQDPNPSICLFANEATDYDTSKRRCQAAGLPMCSGDFRSGSGWTSTCAEGVYQWTDSDCSLKVQVYLSGQVGVVDPVSAAFTPIKIFAESSNNVFRVNWLGGKFPQAKSGCAPGCVITKVASGDTCLCDIQVKERAVFTDPTKIPTKLEILSSLFIGAAKPSSFGANAYVKCTTSTCTQRSDDVTVWIKAGAASWDDSTIFEVAPLYAGGPTIYLANTESIVTVGTTFSFRNPPHFMPLAGEQVQSRQWTSDKLWLPRAQQEVEALLDHLFEHDSSPAFICFRLIQRMVTSNPSPRYLKSVVSAYRTGIYGGVLYSGKYGDLAATVAAILLDREARVPIIEVDPNFGVMREPLLKITHLLRSMEFKTRDSRETYLHQLFNVIGQEAYHAPSVFGFYLPENRPDGPLGDRGQVSPETQILTPPNLIGYLNGVASLIDNGLTACYQGFGWMNKRDCSRPAQAAQTSDGILGYTPSNPTDAFQVIDELDLLLTNGRLNSQTRNYLADQYRSALKTSTPDQALKLVQKLFVTIPEFHTTGANLLKNKARDPPKMDAASQNRDYKAIVVIIQAGGCDSYNMLVPHSNCRQDLYQEYTSVRGPAAIPKSQLLPINVPAGTQPCNTFGLHPAFVNLKALYDAGEALFFANIGALIEPLTKQDYQKQSGVAKRLPPSLFAHNVMSRSSHSLHPQNIAAKGVLGRTVDALMKQASPFKSDLYSLIGNTKLLEGKQEIDFISASRGVQRFLQYAGLIDEINNITDPESESSFSETYIEILRRSLRKAESLGALLSNVKLSTVFGNSGIESQLRQVANLIKVRSSLKTERAVFVTQNTGYDTHNSLDMTNLFGDIDKGLKSFSAEMKAQGIWENVAVVTVSEFGRTLIPNEGGTDHAWAGHHMLVGGGVSGGKIVGTYPTSLTDSSDFSIGRGRMLPTSSWESMWLGLVQWFGVNDAQLSSVLPNLGNFPPEKVFDKDELFKK